MNSSGLSILCTRYVSQSSIGFRVKNCAKNTSSLINSSAFFSSFRHRCRFRLFLLFLMKAVFSSSSSFQSLGREASKSLSTCGLILYLSSLFAHTQNERSLRKLSFVWCSDVFNFTKIFNDFPQNYKTTKNKKKF